MIMAMQQEKQNMVFQRTSQRLEERRYRQKMRKEKTDLMINLCCVHKWEFYEFVVTILLIIQTQIITSFVSNTEIRLVY